MGDICQPTAADYAMAAARDAQYSAEASARRQNKEVARIEKLEERVETLEAAIRVLLHGI